MAMPSNVCEVSDPDLELWASEDQDSGEESDGDTAMDQRWATCTLIPVL